MNEILFNSIVDELDFELSPEQTQKFKQACDKTILENPTLTLADLRTAARIYLNLILDFPRLKL
jgi:hypothetical protein